MDKREFLDRLQKQLADLTVEERGEALEYYEEYFADAGEENEEDVILSLGTPEQVAEQIKAGLHKEEEGMFTENGYREKIESDNPPEVYGKKAEKKRGKGPLPWGRGKRVGAGERSASGSCGQNTDSSRAAGQGADGYYTGSQDNDGYRNGGYSGDDYRAAGQNSDGYHTGGQNTGEYYRNDYREGRQDGYGHGSGQAGRKKEGMSGGTIALLVVLGIFASPLIFGLAAALFGIILGVLGVVLGVIAAIFAVVIGLLAAGVALFFGGFPMLLYHPFSGMICIAAGCFLIALFLLCVAFLVTIFSKFFPWLIREVENFGKYLSRKWSERKGREEV